MKSVPLRPHHLICLQFFRGEGYSEEFIENLGRTFTRLQTEPARIVAGADVVCAACPNLGDDQRCADPGENAISALDEVALTALGVGLGDELKMGDAALLLIERSEATTSFRETECRTCGFREVCAPGWARLLGL
jgi:hypothetical protein